MKWLPTIIVLAAFALLLSIAAQKPEASGARGEPARAAAASTPSEPGGDPGPLPLVVAAQARSSEQPPAEPAAAQDQDTPPTRELPLDTVAGFVVGSSGQGIGGFEVRLTAMGASEPLRTGRSDVDGGFAFEGLASGTYLLDAFDPARLYTVSVPVVVRVPQPDVPGRLEIAVARGRCGIEGFVHDASGQPRTDVEIQALGEEFELSVRTDADGRYTLTGLTAGDWEVRAVEGRRLAPSGEMLEIGSTETVTLREGETQAVPPFQLVMPATLRLSLEPATIDERTYEGMQAVVRVRLVGSSEPPMERTVAFREQTSFGEVWPGEYEISALDERGQSILEGPPLELILEEGRDYSWNLPVRSALRGTGLRVPLGLKVFLAVIFALLLLLPPLLFPKALAPKPPASGTDAAAGSSGESTSS